MDEEMTTNGPTNRLEQKIDALAKTVDRRLVSVEEKIGSVEEKIGTVERKIGTVDGKVETLAASVSAGFKRVDKRFTDVDQQLTDIDGRLRKVHVLAEDTKSFSNNVYDSLATLTKNVEEGFKEAKKDSDEKFDAVHKAVLHWGDKVKVIETARTRRATKRRR